MRQWPERSLDLLLLTFAAGELDAVAYLRGHAFVANMTGNTVLLGLATAGLDRGRAVACLVSMAGFVAGAVVAAYALIRRTVDRGAAAELRRGVFLELPAIALFACSWLLEAPLWTLATAGCAMGIQSVAVRRLEISGVVTTFLTGTITTCIVQWIAPRGSGKASGRSDATLLSAMFLTYVSAAALGGFLSENWPALAPLVPLAAAGLVALRRSTVRT